MATLRRLCAALPALVLACSVDKVRDAVKGVEKIVTSSDECDDWHVSFKPTATDESLEVLAEHIPQNLSELKLDLRHRRVGDVGFGAIAKHFPEFLNALGLWLDGSDVGSAGLQAAAAYFPPSLENFELSLIGCNVSTPALEMVVMQIPASVRGLELVFPATVGDEDLEAIAPYLGNFTHSVGLDLEDTDIGDAGVKAIMLHLNPQLSKFQLSVNNTRVGFHGLISIAKHLPDGTELIFVGPTGFGASALKSLDDVLLAAAEHGDDTLDRVLLKQGADVLARDRAWRTPYDLADSHGHRSAASYLAGHGGNPTQMQLFLQIFTRHLHELLITIAAGIASGALYWFVHRLYGRGRGAEKPCSETRELISAEGREALSRPRQALAPSAGALLLAARAVDARGVLGSKEHYILVVLRFLEIWACWVCPMSVGLYMARPVYFLPLMCVAFLPAGLLQFGPRRLLHQPALVVTTGSGLGWRLFGLVRTSSIIGLLLWAHWATMYYRQDHLAVHDTLEHHLIPQEHTGYQQWTDRHSAFERGPIENVWIDHIQNPYQHAIVNEWPSDMGSWFPRWWQSVLVLAMVWIPAAIVSLLGALAHRSRSAHEQARVAAAIAQEVNELAETIDKVEDIKDLPHHVVPVQVWPSLWPPRSGLVGALLLYKLDVALDLFSILNLVATDNPCFACIMAMIFSVSLTAAYSDGALGALVGDVRVTVRRGVMAERLLHLIRKEAGLEAFLSIAVTVYAMPYSNMTTTSFVVAILSTLTAAWTIASRIYEELDLLDIAVVPKGVRLGRIESL